MANPLVVLLEEGVVAMETLQEIRKVSGKAMLHPIVATGSIFQSPVGGISEIGLREVHVIDFKVQQSLLIRTENTCKLGNATQPLKLLQLFILDPCNKLFTCLMFVLHNYKMLPWQPPATMVIIAVR